MSLLRGEAFVKKVVREGGVLGEERFSKALCFGGLSTGGAVCVDGVADEECGDLVLADKARDGFEVCAKRGAVQREEGLGGEIQGIGDGQADAAVANVEGKNATEGHVGSVGLACT